METASDSLTGKAALHETDSAVRNLCLVWADGRRAFFNYAYLVSADLVVADNPHVIMLYFSGQIVTLIGYQLGLLFDLLLNHMPKIIIATHPRYITDLQPQHIAVIQIVVKSD